LAAPVLEGGSAYDDAMADPVTSLPFSGDAEADALLASSPLALLIGFALDQQVTVQKAFSGPMELVRRTGGLDAASIAAMEPEQLAEVFRTPPALHRFPGMMAGRVQELCAVVAAEYGNDASRIWRDAADAKDLRARLKALPGIGEGKSATIIGVLANRFGVRPAGWEAQLPTGPTLADVDSADALATYQAGKRARKAEVRAAGGKA
jgi:uncharacterized HhH-GPD family protein